MVRLGQLNVRGMRQKIQRRAFFNYFIDSRLDVACIQETHSSEADVDKWKDEWAGDSAWNHGSNDSRGVAILVRGNLKIDVLHKDNNGRIIIANILRDNKILFTVSSLYAPTNNHPTEQLEFF
jgi:exonuclease III